MAPSDRVLEIGCDAGVAVSLICESLAGGSIRAIDRSKSMIERARRRNQAHVESGRAAFHAVALDGAGFVDDRFDKVFAINVRLFRQEAAREAGVLRQLLEPHGAVFLFRQRPSEPLTRAVTDELATALERTGFAVRETVSEGRGRLAHVVHRRPSRRQLWTATVIAWAAGNLQL